MAWIRGVTGCAAWACSGGFVIWYFYDSVWTVSADTSAHALITAGLMERGHLSMADAAVLPDAIVYPHGGHALAAVLGWPFGSVVIGMHLAGLVALAVAWGAIGVLFTMMPVRGSAGAALLGLLALAGVARMDMVGGEIVQNDFLPQLVAQAIVLVAVAAAA